MVWASFDMLARSPSKTKGVGESAHASLDELRCEATIVAAKPVAATPNGGREVSESTKPHYNGSGTT